MRLINADAVLQRLIQETKDSGKPVIHINTIKRILQDIDTAYNVDKVLEKLEEISIEELGINRAQFDMDRGEYSTYCSLSLYDAKKIVKTGGID